MAKHEMKRKQVEGLIKYVDELQKKCEKLAAENNYVEAMAVLLEMSSLLPKDKYPDMPTFEDILDKENPGMSFERWLKQKVNEKNNFSNT